MNFSAILIESLWAGLFSIGIGILLTTPRQYIAPAFFCGFAGRFVRDLFIGWGFTQNWATTVAAAVIVFVAVAFIRRHGVSPVVLVSGVIPLGAAVAMFNMLIQLMKVSILKGAALNEASVVLSASIGKVFTTSLAIALGLEAGISIVRLFGWDEVRERM